jgi:fluoroacetyl-CoA thioesterase
MEFEITPGIEGEKEITVTSDKTATAFCSGTLEVFATPAMIALMEQTAMESVATLLPEPFTTVGTEVSVKHFKPTLPGTTVKLFSRLIMISGMKLLFEVSATDATGLIGKGTHARYIVDKQMFISSILNK